VDDVAAKLALWQTRYREARLAALEARGLRGG